MPTSIDPQPAEDEIECGQCGAHIYYELTRCPHCGVNLYEPGEHLARAHPQSPRPGGMFAWMDGLIRRITRKPYPADELFGTAIDQAALFNNLLRKVGGDRLTAERLVDFERRQAPGGNRLAWLENAIRRWEQDNRDSGSA